MNNLRPILNKFKFKLNSNNRYPIIYNYELSITTRKQVISNNTHIAEIALYNNNVLITDFLFDKKSHYIKLLYTPHELDYSILNEIFPYILKELAIKS